MSTSYISVDLRRLVVERADGLCEYCLIHQDDTYFGCEVDHIISEKHGGTTQAGNLALACLICNRNKGSDLASVVPGTDRLTRFFNPRAEMWAKHFRLAEDGVTISPLTEVGEATARILVFNSTDRRAERAALVQLDRYPPLAARRRMTLSR